MSTFQDSYFYRGHVHDNLVSTEFFFLLNSTLIIIKFYLIKSNTFNLPNEKRINKLDFERK
jgi:hypothetical protein